MRLKKNILAAFYLSRIWGIALWCLLTQWGMAICDQVSHFKYLFISYLPRRFNEAFYFNSIWSISSTMYRTESGSESHSPGGVPEWVAQVCFSNTSESKLMHYIYGSELRCQIILNCIFCCWIFYSLALGGCLNCRRDLKMVLLLVHEAISESVLVLGLR